MISYFLTKKKEVTHNILDRAACHVHRLIFEWKEKVGHALNKGGKGKKESTTL